MSIEYNPEYIHHTHPGHSAMIRELVFGMEDGMVSTLGAVTGIAAATHDPFVAVLSGLVVVAVESVSMGVGSYLSSKSVVSIDERKLAEEKEELREYPAEEKRELIDMYVESGWTKETAMQMAEEASKNDTLFLQEMALRELKVFQGEAEEPVKNGIVMGISYIVGGAVPLLPYFFNSLSTSVVVSIIITLIGLFCLGVYTTKFSKRRWWQAGLEMMALASAAALIGYAVGQVADWWLAK